MPFDGFIYMETWEPGGFEVKGRTATWKFTQFDVGC